MHHYKLSHENKKCIQQNPWLTKGLLNSIKTNKSYKKLFLNGNKEYANKLTRVKNFSKKMYYNITISEQKNNPKKLWKFINSMLPSKCSSFSTSVIIVNNCNQGSHTIFKIKFHDFS